LLREVIIQERRSRPREHVFHRWAARRQSSRWSRTWHRTCPRDAFSHAAIPCLAVCGIGLLHLSAFVCFIIVLVKRCNLALTASHATLTPVAMEHGVY
jgi:hypothetical protein